MRRQSFAVLAVLCASCLQHTTTERAVLHGGGVHAELTNERAELEVGGHEVSLRAAALGRGHERFALGSGRPTRMGDEVHTTRAPGVVEWWRPLAAGLEHGVTLAARPAGQGELTLELEVGGLRPETRADDAVALLDAGGVARATYAGLFVLDANARALPAHLEARGDRIVITFDDSGARYPVVVDPMVALAFEATLPATMDSPPDAASLGAAVAIDADGTRAIVGAPLDTQGTVRSGSARVFVRSGTSWTEEAILIGGGADDQFGTSVALSSDGAIAVVGAPRTVSGTGRAGSAFVFVRTGSAWTLEATLTAMVPDAGGRFGRSVALSGDGRHLLVGEPGFSNSGRATHFEHTGTTWTRVTELLVPGVTAHDGGISVALSGDGSLALIGAPIRGSFGTGHAAVFTRAGTTWTYGGDLPGPGGTILGEIGTWVTLSADGSTATAGGDTRSDVYTRSGSTWTRVQQVGSTPGSLSSNGSLLVDTATARLSLWSRAGSTWSVVGYFPVSATTTAVTSDGTRVVAGVPSRSVGGVSGAGAADVFVIRPAADLGGACANDTDCLSDQCADGVCCNSDCGGSRSDCQACSAALTGGVDGTCAALSATAAPTVICRVAGAQPCDGPEVCTAGSTSCPPPGPSPAGTPCRDAATSCDAAEVCDGIGNDCPADAPAAVGTECRPPAGACDVAELCDGVGFSCPAADTRVPPGLVCRSAVGTCDIEETCDGSSPVCPPDVVVPAGITCLPSSGSECDLPDVCSGLTGVCPPTYQPATQGCGDPVAGVCDAPDHCTGTSADCLADFLADVECRGSTGGCDPAELCTGDRADCPPDQISPTGMVCRASIGACDPAESCDGVANLCPADRTSCGDAESTDGGGSGADAGAPPPTNGCSCRASRSRPPPLLLALVLGAVLMRRRQR
jgi:MYXO-CTERM domain-containing protein